MVFIDISKNEWTDEETALGRAILQKIAACQDRGAGLPGPVFEAHVRSKKNLSTEVVVFNRMGQVYLIERPTLEQNPTEPYPGQLHSPGVTHTKNELTGDTLHRLVDKEFGGVELASIVKVDEIDARDNQRGMYRMLIYVGVAEVEPKNPKGSFWNIDDIPWERIVPTHRDALLQRGIEAYHAQTTALLSESEFFDSDGKATGEAIDRAEAAMAEAGDFDETLTDADLDRTEAELDEAAFHRVKQIW